MAAPERGAVFLGWSRRGDFGSRPLCAIVVPILGLVSLIGAAQAQTTRSRPDHTHSPGMGRTGAPGAVVTTAIVNRVLDPGLLDHLSFDRRGRGRPPGPHQGRQARDDAVGLVHGTQEHAPAATHAWWRAGTVHVAVSESGNLIGIRQHCGFDRLSLLSFLCALDLLAFGTNDIAPLRLVWQQQPFLFAVNRHRAQCFALESALARLADAKYSFVGCAACKPSGPCFPPFSIRGPINQTSCRGSQDWIRAPARPLIPPFTV